MTTAAGSVELHEIAGQLIRVLASLEGRLVRGDVMHMRHSDLSSRATQFSGYLEAALLLVERSHFPQAFSVALAAPEWAFRADSFDVRPGWLVYTLIASAVAAAVGGLVAAVVARRRRGRWPV